MHPLLVRIRPVSPVLPVLLGVAISTFLASTAFACNTPVYRYAMYNWGTSPHLAFLFHAGPIAGKNAEIGAILDDLVRRSPPPNLVYRVIDVEDEEVLNRLDPDVRRFWETQGEKKSPWWLVVSAWGGVLHCGEDWDAQAAEGLADSPLRRRIAERLHDGDAVVFLLLEGNDEKENAAAGATAEKVVADTNSGEIASAEEALVVELGGPATAGAAEEPALSASLLRVSADATAEQGLIGQLLMVEPGLKEELGTPMLFAVYGRGRAMQPFIGKGINEHNLADAVRFLAGDCSCLAKEQNPGVDLCIAWDWEATADKWSLEEEANPATRRGSPNALVYREYSLDDLGGTQDPGGEKPDDTHVGSVESEEKERLVFEAAAEPPLDRDSEFAEAEIATPPESNLEDSLGQRQIWTVSLLLVALALGVIVVGAVFMRR